MTTYQYTITLDDSELIMLENLLKDTVSHYRETNKIFKELSDEGKFGCEEQVLQKLKDSFTTSVMMSTSTFCWDK
jgi:hypothetical protein